MRSYNHPTTPSVARGRNARGSESEVESGSDAAYPLMSRVECCGSCNGEDAIPCADVYSGAPPARRYQTGKLPSTCIPWP